MGLTPPWGIVQRYGFSVPLSFQVWDDWSIGFAPSVDWVRENGASNSDSVVWGALVSGTKRFDDGNRLGLGVGVYDRIDTTAVFPFLIVDWRLGDRWRVINPLPSGPTGPAGLELDYQFDGGWTAGVGAAWRVLRFRLSDTGPTPNGIGEERGAPIFLRVTRNFSDQMALHLYGGVVVAGKLRLENSSGGLLREDDFDAAPLFGAWWWRPVNGSVGPLTFALCPCRKDNLQPLETPHAQLFRSDRTRPRHGTFRGFRPGLSWRPFAGFNA